MTAEGTAGAKAQSEKRVRHIHPPFAWDWKGLSGEASLLLLPLLSQHCGTVIHPSHDREIN